MNDILRRVEIETYRRQVADDISLIARNQAAVVTRSSDSLGLLMGGMGSINDSLVDIASDIARFVAVAEDALPAIVESLTQQSVQLGSIGEMIAKPRRTNAADLYDTGIKFLGKVRKAETEEERHEWYEKAVTDLAAATRRYPDFPQAWFNLGLAYAGAGSIAESAKAFAECALFAADEYPVLAASAVLLSSSEYRQAGLNEESLRILRKFFGRLKRCAEIHLTLAVHHGEIERLREALVIWPYLAADARKARLPNAESEAARLCEDREGPAYRLFGLEDAIRRLWQSIAEAKLTDVAAPPVAVLLPSPGVERLLLVLAVWESKVSAARKLMHETSANIAALAEAARHAETRLGKSIDAKRVAVSTSSNRANASLIVDAAATSRTISDAQDAKETAKSGVLNEMHALEKLLNAFAGHLAENWSETLKLYYSHRLGAATYHAFNSVAHPQAEEHQISMEKSLEKAKSRESLYAYYDSQFRAAIDAIPDDRPWLKAMSTIVYKPLQLRLLKEELRQCKLELKDIDMRIKAYYHDYPKLKAARVRQLTAFREQTAARKEGIKKRIAGAVVDDQHAEVALKVAWEQAKAAAEAEEIAAKACYEAVVAERAATSKRLESELAAEMQRVVAAGDEAIAANRAAFDVARSRWNTAWEIVRVPLAALGEYLDEATKPSPPRTIPFSSTGK